MKTRDIIEGAKLALTAAVLYKGASFLGFIKSREEKKAEQNTQNAYTGQGKMGKAFSNTYVNELIANGQINNTQLQLIQNNLGNLIDNIYNAWGTFDDDEQAVKSAYLQINSIAQASLVNRGLMEKANFNLGTTYTNGLEVLQAVNYLGQSFLNDEELQIYVYEPLSKKNYLP